MNWLHASTAALNASAKAHDRWDVPTDRWIDVFDAAARQGIFLAFRPLGKLGAAIIAEPSAGTGIIVNSNHPLSRQRYSVAHELGHLFFKHPSTLDASDFLEKGRAVVKTDEEKLAESFASWFLMPPDLLNAYTARRGINRINTAEEVYQLSLFLGTSYESTVHHLHYTKRAAPQRAASWLEERPQSIKQRLCEGFEPESWRSDVHLLDESDDRTSRLVRAGDRIIMHLNEIPSSGYRWQLCEEVPFTVLFDEYVAEYAASGERGVPTGALRTRKFVLAVDDVEERADVTLALIQCRAWRRREPARRFELGVTIESKQRLGFPPRYLQEIAA